MFKPFVLTLVFVFFFLNDTLPQNFQKAYAAIADKQFDKALQILDKAQQKKATPLLVNYGYMLYYSAHDNPSKSDKSAFRYAKKSARYFQKYASSDTDKLKQEYGIEQIVIQQVLFKTSENQYNKAIQNGSIQALQQFLNSFSNSPFDSLAEDYLVRLHFLSISDSNNPADFQRFLRNFPQSVYTDSAQQKYKFAFVNLFHQATSDKDASSYTLFRHTYPDYPFYTAEDSLNIKAAFVASTYGFEKSYNPDNAQTYIDFIQQYAPSEFAFIALQRIISPFLHNNRFTQAYQTVKEFQPYFTNDKKYNLLLELLNRPEEPVVPQTLPNQVNSLQMEYSPVITANDEMLYFCGRNRKDNMGLEDIFVAKRIGNNQFKKSRLIQGVNTATDHEAPLSISADGTTMLVYSRQDVYFSRKNANSWTPLNKMPAINLDNSWEADAMITADGKALLFVSDRRGNIGTYHPFGKLFHGDYSGNLDIYVSVLHSSGKWLPPINLGKNINTPYTERGAFLHPDMKTLYFSSDGHGGLGSLDVFMSQRLNDSSWTEWSEPVNLGRYINTAGKDYHLKISTDGQKVYYAKTTATNNSDIAVFTLPTKYRPQLVATLSGYVFGSANQKLDATVQWEDLETGQLMGYAETDPETKKYFITLPYGRNYGFFVEKTNYYPSSGYVDLVTPTKQHNIEKDIYLLSFNEIENTPIRLQNLFFDTNQATLKPESFPELNRLVKFLKNNSLSVQIIGHTDNQGAKEYNLTLSHQRALAVKNYLAKAGIEIKRIQAIGKGDNQPVASNDSPEGRLQNRRVELKILK